MAGPLLLHGKSSYCWRQHKDGLLPAKYQFRVINYPIKPRRQLDRIARYYAMKHLPGRERYALLRSVQEAYVKDFLQTVERIPWVERLTTLPKEDHDRRGVYKFLYDVDCPPHRVRVVNEAQHKWLSLDHIVEIEAVARHEISGRGRQTLVLEHYLDEKRQSSFSTKKSVAALLVHREGVVSNVLVCTADVFDGLYRQPPRRPGSASDYLTEYFTEDDWRLVLRFEATTAMFERIGSEALTRADIPLPPPEQPLIITGENA